MAQTNVPVGTNGPVILTWSNQVLNGARGLTKPYARFRLSTDQSAINSPSGDAPDGEVEDYQPTFASSLPVNLPKATSTINVKSLPSGVYILEVKTVSRQVLSQRFIKQ